MNFDKLAKSYRVSIKRAEEIFTNFDSSDEDFGTWLWDNGYELSSKEFKFCIHWAALTCKWD